MRWVEMQTWPANAYAPNASRVDGELDVRVGLDEHGRVAAELERDLLARVGAP